MNWVTALYFLRREQVFIRKRKYITKLTLNSPATDSQWGHIFFKNKESATKALKELNGDLFGAKTLALTPGGIREPSIFHDISGHITLSYANGKRSMIISFSPLLFEFIII